MANGVVNLLISTFKRGNVINETSRDIDVLSAKAGRLEKAFEILSSTVGGAGGTFVKLVGSIFQGGVWAIGAQAIQWVVGLLKKHKEASQEAAEAEKKAFDERSKAIEAYRSQVEKCYQASISAIDQNLKKIYDEVDATKELQKAELELERERLRAAGDSAGLSGIDDKVRALDAESSAEKMMAGLDAAEKRVEAAKKRAADMPLAVGAAEAIAKTAGDAVDKAIAEARRKGEMASRSVFSVATGGASETGVYSADERAALEAGFARDAQAAVDSFKKTSAYADLVKARDEANAALSKAREERNRAESDLNLAQSHLSNLEKRADAMLVRADALAVKAENDASEARAKAEVDAASKREAEIKKEHDARVKGIEDELRARLEAERKVQAEAASRFEREFALWKDPSARDRRFDDEQRRRDDIALMQADVRKANAGGRVSEIAALMRAGDDEQIEKRFQTWRAGGWFNGMKRDEEQLIRTAAAYETRNQSEQNLSDIAKNTANLDRKLDELISMKG